MIPRVPGMKFCRINIVSPLLKIQNEREYDLALERLNGLIDEVGTDERHPLYFHLPGLKPPALAGLL